VNIAFANGPGGNTFQDVEPAHPFAGVSNIYYYDSVQRIAASGVSGGCSTNPALYCPEAVVTRGQMAVYLLRAQNGPAYTPPACTPRFGDVPCSNPFAIWVNELAARGITSGCGGGNYCPNTPVSRDQMAVFLLKTRLGSAYIPPACTAATFSDVPCSNPYATWIYDLVARGITAGCGAGSYCPTAAVGRGQMAVFVVRMFGL
jgi:S-layer family protein